MSSQTDTLDMALARRGEGEARWWIDCLAEIKLTAEQTGGLLSVLEITEAPNPDGVPGPLHVHHREDETFWVLEGSASFEVGDAKFDAAAGDVVFGPRDVPHRYTPGPEGCRLLFIMTPGGFEKLVREMSVPAQERTLPPASSEEPDWEHAAAVARANGCELLG